MQDASIARGGLRHARCVLDSCDQRLLAEHVKAGVKRPLDQRGVAARGRANVDEIERFAGQQIIDGFMPPAIGTGGEKRLATRRGGVGRSDNPHVVPRAPARQVAVGRDIAEADEGASEHADAQSSENRRAIAAKD